MKYNPYSWNTVNPNICYGRDNLLYALLNGLPGSPRYFFGIAGGRRMGKSTLLRRVEQELVSGVGKWREGGLLVLPIYVDGLELPRPLTASDVWLDILNKVQNNISSRVAEVPQVIDFGTFRSVMASIISTFSERPRIIVMFDEIEPIMANDWGQGFLAHWRSLLTNSPGLSEYFTAVFAGAQEMALLRKDITSPIADILEWYNLKALDFIDTSKLMEEPIERHWGYDIRFKLYKETGGQPMLVQYLMEQLASIPDNLAHEQLRSAIEKFDIERKWQFAEWWQRYCSPVAQRVYSRLPDDGSTISLRKLTMEFGLDDANVGLEILQHVGIASAEDDGFVFRYNGEMFRRWYRRYATLAEADLHDPEIYRLLQSVNEDLSDKYISAWQIFRTELSTYSGAIGEMRDILSLLLDYIAPDKDVVSQPNFRLEPNTNSPTRRQRVHYAARMRFSKENTKQVMSDFELLEINCDKLAQLATSAYRTSSGLSHTVATKPQAYRVLKQWDNIFAQLIADVPPK